jgi:hypothetical protein
MASVESEYRVAKDGTLDGRVRSRLLIGMNGLDKFAWIGAFSSGGIADDFEKDFQGLDAKANAQIRLLRIACGAQHQLITVNRKPGGG